MCKESSAEPDSKQIRTFPSQHISQTSSLLEDDLCYTGLPSTPRITTNVLLRCPAREEQAKQDALDDNTI